VTSLRQPGLQTRLCGREIDPGHPDLRECEFLPPRLNVRDKLSRIETGIHTPPIVETAPVTAWTGRWASEADTQTFALRLASSPAIANASLSLQGDLGAGKTTLVRHLLRALGVQGRIKSPTYAVVEPHTADANEAQPESEPLNIWHFDFYRFSDPREWEDAGFRELFASPGLKLVEWPERAAGFLPPMDAQILIQTDDNAMTDTASNTASSDPFDHPPARLVRITAFTPVGQRLLAALMA
jgi:tRNA threonylcarbamoyladenosine biosynthesis protein TsaE